MKEFSLFEIIGPNMIGPSSSHTAGACRLGKVVHKLARGKVNQVTFVLYGSFAKTYRGHGTDKALLAGVLGLETDDEGIRHSYQLAEQQNLKFSFQEGAGKDMHPNTVQFLFETKTGETMTMTGASIGGGNIEITEIDGVALTFTGEYPTLIISHMDKPGVIAGVTAILSQYQINIAFMRVYRHNKGKNAFMIIEADNQMEPELIAAIKGQDHIVNAYLVSL